MLSPGSVEFATTIAPVSLIQHGRDMLAELVAAEARRQVLEWWDASGPREGESPEAFERRFAHQSGQSTINGVESFVSTEPIE